MTKAAHIVLTLATLMTGLAAAAQTPVSQVRQVRTSIPQSQDGEFSVFSSITKYLAAGDATSLSSWFADNLDVTVISSSRNCSKTQARQILRTFFDTYTPRSFEVTHKASESNKKYLIGQLNAGGELFQVTIYATSSGGSTYRIQQLSISRQTAY
ncbi:MAG: DUF4783 domain-containing protein [Bacteroidales bacterium]|nr:DUF4783 domain-containing protein [Bacteroidales bacterium]